MKIPFTKYELKISKRGAKFIKEGQLVSFADWTKGISFATSTPILEEVYTTIASEFAKIDLKHVLKKNGQYEHRNDDLNYVVSERPNPYQTKYDLLFTLAYQRAKFGNAMAFLRRNERGFVIGIDPINAEEYLFGNGYKIDEDTILYKFKNKKTNEIELVEYSNIIHLRANPNDIFYGDMFSGASANDGLIDLVDASLTSLVNELRDNGTVRGVIQIGSSATGLANKMMQSDGAKISKQQEIINRIKATKGGILVLDAGEEWKSISNPFETTSTQQIDKYIDLLLQFNGVNRAVVEGTATSAQMDVFFAKTIAPIIDQFISELNYKVFSKTARSQGNRIEYYRNPFEYISITEAIDIAYKGIQDTTTNERRSLIYKLPPVEGGDIIVTNKNFEIIDTKGEKSDEDQ